MLSRMLDLCKARLRYELPCEETVRRQLQLLGAEGKAIARDFLVRCLASGVKISITGDLWSENGMGLFGIFAHGMPAYEMEKALIGLVACESERHTADNIESWTEDALKGVGLTAPSLLGTADGGNDLATANQKLLQPSDLTRLGIEHNSVDPDDFIFKKVSDNGANIKCAWDDDALWGLGSVR